RSVGFGIGRTCVSVVVPSIDERWIVEHAVLVSEHHVAPGRDGEERKRQRFSRDSKMKQSKTPRAVSCTEHAIGPACSGREKSLDRSLLRRSRAPILDTANPRL